MRSASGDAGALRDWEADLHLHSVLSPCGDLEMSPTAIVRRAREVGLSLVALTDHNTAENGGALRVAASEMKVDALYGLEVRSEEEVDLLCLFDDLDAAMGLQETAYAALPDIPNDPLLFGDQVVVDRDERIIRVETRLLIGAVALPLQDVVREVHRRDGLAIPAHVDRSVNSLTSQLGFPPAGCAFDAMEVSPFGKEEKVRVLCPWLCDYPIVRFSDAHFLGEIGRQRTRFRVCAPAVDEIRMALRGEGGRGFET